MFEKHSSQDHGFKLCNESKECRSTILRHSLMKSLTKEFILGLQQGRANLQTYIVFVSHQAEFDRKYMYATHMMPPQYLMQVFGGNLLSTALVCVIQVPLVLYTPSAIPVKNFGQHYFSICCHVSFIIIHHEFVLHIAQKGKTLLICTLLVFAFTHLDIMLTLANAGIVQLGVETNYGKAQF